MHLVTSVKLFGSFLRSRAAHLHGLATAGAMLTCLAIVLNVGPLAKAPKTQGEPDSARRQAARASMEQPVALTSTLQVEPGAPPQADHPPLPKRAADISESTRPLIEVAPVPMVGVAPQPTMGAVDIVEPITTLIEPASTAVIDVAPPASQPAMSKDADGEIQPNSPQQVFAAAGPQVQLPGDHVNPEPIKKAAIVGFWAPDAGTCSARDFREGMLPAVINADGAWAGDTFCVFKNKKQTETGLSAVAKCSNPREHWTANVRLTVHDNRLTWTSKRGTQTYTRCAPDVLMANAR